jgi:short-subunit dehydrogenase
MENRLQNGSNRRNADRARYNQTTDRSDGYFMNKIQGCNAILTGASKGLGACLAEAFAREGVNLALTARSAELLEKVRLKISATGVKAVAIPADLENPSQIDTLAREAEQKLGSVDLLINNAGVEMTAPLESYPSDAIKTSVNVNLLAPMLLTRAVLPGMLKRGYGHIVNISSLAGKIGLPSLTPYATTKSGLIMFSHSLRTELIDEPVGVSVVCPGFISDSGMYARKIKTDVTVPRTLKPTTADRVVSAVVRAIRKDIAELIVNPLPMRPVTILRETFTGITPYIHKVFGITEFVRALSGNSADE